MQSFAFGAAPWAQSLVKQLIFSFEVFGIESRADSGRNLR